MPRSQGGLGATLPEFFRLLVALAQADSNLPQLLRGHFGFVESRLVHPDGNVRDRWLRRISDGMVVGNAQSELGNRSFWENATTISEVPDGRGWRLTGKKFYSTGSLFADWIHTTATVDGGHSADVLVPTAAQGVHRLDDWDGFGQRLTGSGTTLFEDVEMAQRPHAGLAQPAHLPPPDHRRPRAQRNESERGVRPELGVSAWKGRCMTASEQKIRVPVLSTEEAVEAAAELATDFAAAAAWRDAERILPSDELDRLSASGLLATTVPATYGGADLPVATVVEVIRLLSVADPNIGQIPHSHFVYVSNLRLHGTPAQQSQLFAEVLAGKRFGNAQSEAGTKHVRDIRTTLVPDGPGRWRLNGRKFYATGALLADWIPVLAHLDVDGPLHVAWVERTTPGVEVIDDWNGLGQRTTASGSVVLTDVSVTTDLITPYAVTFDGPQTYGAFAQVLHAAIDAGIARAAVLQAAAFVRDVSRPYPDAGVERAADDPLVIHAFGEMELAVRAAEALLKEAAAAVDRAGADLTVESAGQASLAVAAARAATTSAALEASTRLFEVAGTRSAAASLRLDRHWRNARTHTLHDPAAWKIQHLGHWAVTGTLPPNHGQL
ncbi:SfnB family sulfur acquisition oxidoreductase [Sphaerisporangium perillae]|uniref:SfnB family sulfur acquisition oxidoreductase n=1 Tax=Sphaerisporangium perillae TaxID=2935860 RepID=UPI002010224F|nr:SfnB family sulfur acquisition oxidoreductase [Sphaerisporangium perillae]